MYRSYIFFMHHIYSCKSYEIIFIVSVYPEDNVLILEKICGVVGRDFVLAHSSVR